MFRFRIPLGILNFSSLVFFAAIELSSRTHVEMVRSGTTTIKDELTLARAWWTKGSSLLAIVSCGDAQTGAALDSMVWLGTRYHVLGDKPSELPPHQECVAIDAGVQNTWHLNKSCNLSTLFNASAGFKMDSFTSSGFLNTAYTYMRVYKCMKVTTQ